MRGKIVMKEHYDYLSDAFVMLVKQICHRFNGTELVPGYIILTYSRKSQTEEWSLISTSRWFPRGKPDWLYPRNNAH